MTLTRKEVGKCLGKCLGRAKQLLNMMFIQTSTDPTYSDLLDIMGLRSGLQEERFQMEAKLDYFLQYDEEFICEAIFYEELSALGRATEKNCGQGLIGVRRVFTLPNGCGWDFPELQDRMLTIGLGHHGLCG